eukprot:4462108-Ditylum_brightwellii.AAC.1
MMTNIGGWTNVYIDVLEEVHKSTADKSRAMKKHINFMLKDNEEVEILDGSDSFATYACKHQKLGNGSLEYESATDYLSSFKDHFLLEFKHLSQPKPLDDKMWSQIWSKLRRIKGYQAVSQHKLLIKSKDVSNDDDRWNMFGMCVWGDTASDVSNIAKDVYFALAYYFVLDHHKCAADAYVRKYIDLFEHGDESTR